MIKRSIRENIEKSLFKGKIVIIYGARQVGKTTLVKEIQKKYPDDSVYFNCDEPDIRSAFSNKTSTEIKSFFGNKKLIILDEAQRVKNIGLALKLIVDTYPEIQVIATGSSSFDLSNQIIEPLTGRKYEFYLYPFSLKELSAVYSDLEIDRIIEQRMIFGMYPEIVFSGPEAETKLKNIARSYLYKDILQFQNIKNSEVIDKLLRALALQVGNEVSYNELAQAVGADKNTVANYIQILEKAFVVFRLPPFSRNLRNELKKLRKIYFFDTGVRNALINNFNSLDMRQDKGSLWENFIISERIKHNRNREIDKNNYFWRTKEGREIDFLEEGDGKINGLEIKWSAEEKFKMPEIFLKTYPNSQIEVINRKNYQEKLFK
ncbi:MAG: ATP-binding protein [bacterium]|nr:ATP-binding protein [bacterium]